VADGFSRSVARAPTHGQRVPTISMAPQGRHPIPAIWGRSRSVGSLGLSRLALGTPQVAGNVTKGFSPRNRNKPFPLVTAQRFLLWIRLKVTRCCWLVAPGWVDEFLLHDAPAFQAAGLVAWDTESLGGHDDGHTSVCTAQCVAFPAVWGTRRIPPPSSPNSVAH
jgi:hypothetical protein